MTLVIYVCVMHCVYMFFNDILYHCCIDLMVVIRLGYMARRSVLIQSTMCCGLILYLTSWSAVTTLLQLVYKVLLMYGD